MRDPLLSPVPNADDAKPEEGLRIVRFDGIHDAGTEDRSAMAFDAFEQRSTGFADLELGATHLNRSATGATLESLAHTGMAVTGIDVMSAIAGRPLDPLQQWRCEPGAGESPAAFARRSHKMACEFFHAYPDPGDDSIVYVVISQPSDAQEANC